MLSLKATSKIVDSILEEYSSKFTQEEKECLKNYKFERLHIDIDKIFISHMEARVIGQNIYLFIF